MNKEQEEMGKEGVSVWDWERENGMCFGPQLASPFPQDYSVEGMSTQTHGLYQKDGVAWCLGL